VGDANGIGLNFIANNQGNGVLIAGAGTTGNLIQFDYIVSNGQNGVSVNQAPGNSIENCQIEANAWWGIYLYQSDPTTRINNLFGANGYGDVS